MFRGCPCVHCQMLRLRFERDDEFLHVLWETLWTITECFQKMWTSVPCHNKDLTSLPAWILEQVETFKEFSRCSKAWCRELNVRLSQNQYRLGQMVARRIKIGSLLGSCVFSAEREGLHSRMSKQLRFRLMKSFSGAINFQRRDSMLSSDYPVLDSVCKRQPRNTMSCGNFSSLPQNQKPTQIEICDAEQNLVLLLVDLDSQQNQTYSRKRSYGYRIQ